MLDQITEMSREWRDIDRDLRYWCTAGLMGFLPVDKYFVGLQREVQLRISDYNTLMGGNLMDISMCLYKMMEDLLPEKQPEGTI